MLHQSDGSTTAAKAVHGGMRSQLLVHRFIWFMESISPQSEEWILRWAILHRSQRFSCSPFSLPETTTGRTISPWIMRLQWGQELQRKCIPHSTGNKMPLWTMTVKDAAKYCIFWNEVLHITEMYLFSQNLTSVYTCLTTKWVLLTSHTTMASWFMPFCPCWVKIQEDLLFPFVEILLCTEGNCWKLMTHSGNNPLVVLFLRGLNGKHNVDFFPPLVPVEKQPPIPSALLQTHPNIFTILTAKREEEKYRRISPLCSNRN